MANIVAIMWLSIISIDIDYNSQTNYLLKSNCCSAIEYTISFSSKTPIKSVFKVFKAKVYMECHKAWALDSASKDMSQFPFGIPRRIQLCNANIIEVLDE